MRIRTVALLVAVATLSFAGAFTFMNRSEPAKSASAPVVITAAHETYTSDTAADWATNADYIVDVSVSSDKERPTSDATFAERVAKFHVNQILLARDGATTLPADVDVSVAGWIKDAKTQAKRPILPSVNVPRFEVGHRYIVALIFQEPRCNPDDGVYPGGWMPIGSGAGIPFDDGKLGAGEVGGKVGGLLGDTAIFKSVKNGQSVSDLVATLKATPKGERITQPGERIGC